MIDANSRGETCLAFELAGAGINQQWSERVANQLEGDGWPIIMERGCCESWTEEPGVFYVVTRIVRQDSIILSGGQVEAVGSQEARLPSTGLICNFDPERLAWNISCRLPGRIFGQLPRKTLRMSIALRLHGQDILGIRLNAIVATAAVTASPPSEDMPQGQEPVPTIFMEVHGDGFHGAMALNTSGAGIDAFIGGHAPAMLETRVFRDNPRAGIGAEKSSGSVHGLVDSPGQRSLEGMGIGSSCLAKALSMIASALQSAASASPLALRFILEGNSDKAVCTLTVLGMLISGFTGEPPASFRPTGGRKQHWLRLLQNLGAAATDAAGSGGGSGSTVFAHLEDWSPLPDWLIPGLKQELLEIGIVPRKLWNEGNQ